MRVGPRRAGMPYLVRSQLSLSCLLRFLRLLAFSRSSQLRCSAAVRPCGMVRDDTQFLIGCMSSSRKRRKSVSGMKIAFHRTRLQDSATAWSNMSFPLRHCSRMSKCIRRVIPNWHHSWSRRVHINSIRMLHASIWIIFYVAIFAVNHIPMTHNSFQRTILRTCNVSQNNIVFPNNIDPRNIFFKRKHPALSESGCCMCMLVIYPLQSQFSHSHPSAYNTPIGVMKLRLSHVKRPNTTSTTRRRCFWIIWIAEK